MCGLKPRASAPFIVDHQLYRMLTLGAKGISAGPERGHVRLSPIERGESGGLSSFLDDLSEETVFKLPLIPGILPGGRPPRCRPRLLVCKSMCYIYERSTPTLSCQKR